MVQNMCMYVYMYLCIVFCSFCKDVEKIFTVVANTLETVYGGTDLQKVLSESLHIHTQVRMCVCVCVCMCACVCVCVCVCICIMYMFNIVLCYLRF